MTNGEKIKEIFPSMLVGFITESQIGIYFVKNQHSAVVFSLDWWNAEYKESTNMNDKVDCKHTDCNNCVNHKYCDYEPNKSENPTGSTTKNCESCRYYGLHHDMCNYCYKCSLWTEKKTTTKNDLGVDNTPNTISFKEMIDRLNLTTDDIEKAEDLDFEIESLMPSYSKLLKANNQLKKQIEMLKLDRDCDKPSGKWIANAPQYDMLNPQYICSECGNAHTRTTPYCEMCGAKMESEDNNTSCQG